MQNYAILVMLVSSLVSPCSAQTLQIDSLKIYTGFDLGPDGPAFGSPGFCAMDSTGGLWFGPREITYTGQPQVQFVGALFFNGVSWRSFSTVDGLASNSVRDIEVDRKNTIWFATSSGVTQYDGITWKTFTQSDGLASNDTYSIAIENGSIIWVGTANGASRYDGVSWKTYKVSDGLGWPVVKIIKIDQRTNTKWFAVGEFDHDGYYQGRAVIKYDGSKWNTYRNAFWKFPYVIGLIDEFVTDIEIANNGDVWFATDFSGITFFQNNSITAYGGGQKFIYSDGEWKFESSLAIRDLYLSYVETIFSSSDGSVWLGRFQHLVRYKNMVWQDFPIGNDENHIYDILVKNNSDIWLCASHGIIFLNFDME